MQNIGDKSVRAARVLIFRPTRAIIDVFSNAEIFAEKSGWTIFVELIGNWVSSRVSLVYFGPTRQSPLSYDFQSISTLQEGDTFGLNGRDRYLISLNLIPKMVYC